MKAILVAVLFTAGAVQMPAFGQETPVQLKGGKVASVDESKRWVDTKSVTFVDTRSVVNYGKGHIPGAISVAYKEKSDKVADFDPSKDELDMSKLPADKKSTIVFYSDGPTGWKSYKAAVLALQRGYSDVVYFRGGFAEWTGKGLPTER